MNFESVSVESPRLAPSQESCPGDPNEDRISLMMVVRRASQG